MYKKILVPLDGSARAERILPHVEQLAFQNRARVIFIKVVKPIFLTDGYQTISVDESLAQTNERIEEANMYLKKTEGEFREKGIDTKLLVKSGPVVEIIVSVAQQENVDLIAMASHGRGGLSRVFYGSVAAGVLHQVDRPLLLIRSRQT